MTHSHQPHSFYWKWLAIRDWKTMTANLTSTVIIPHSHHLSVNWFACTLLKPWCWYFPGHCRSEHFKLYGIITCTEPYLFTAVGCPGSFLRTEIFFKLLFSSTECESDECLLIFFLPVHNYLYIQYIHNCYHSTRCPLRHWFESCHSDSVDCFVANVTV